MEAEYQALGKVNMWAIAGRLSFAFVALTLAAMIAGRAMVNPLLAFEAARPKNIALYLADPRYGLAVNLTVGWTNDTEPAWSGDGRLTFASSVILDQDIYTLTLDQHEPINISQTAHSHSPAWSPGERLAFVTEHDSGTNSIDVLDPDGNRQHYTLDLSSELSNLESPSWLSEHELVFLGSIRSGQKQVFLLDLDNGNLRNLSNLRTLIQREPLASPDGKYVAFISDDPGRAKAEQLVSVWDKVTDTLVEVTHNTGLNRELSWSKDGRLAFASTMNGNSEIYVWDAQTKALTDVSNNPGVDEFPAWSDDGRLAFVSNRSGEAGIYCLDPATGLIEPIYILHGSSSPVWSK